MKRILLFLGIALLFCRCSDDLEPFLVFNVETDYRIDLRENLSEAKKELLLEINTTIADFTCEDAEIVTQSSILGEEIIIDIKEIRLSAGCNDNGGSYPAKTFLNLGELESGNYQLTFSIGEALFNYGILVVTDKTYEVIFEEELNGIEIPNTQLTKMPSGTIWGRLKYDANVSPVLQSLQSGLVDLGAAPKSLASGNYTNFSIDSDNIIHWDEENTFLYENTLLYVYGEDDINQLGGIIDSINADYGDTYDFEIDMFTYNGLEY